MEDEKTKLTKKRRQTRIEAAIASTNHALPMALEAASAAYQYTIVAGNKPGAFGEVIHSVGELLRSKLIKAGFRLPSLDAGNNEERQVLVEGEIAALGSAWYLAGSDLGPFWREFERQYYSDPLTVSQEINSKAARRARYRRQAGIHAARGRRSDQLHQDMLHWLQTRIARDPVTDVPRVDEEVLGKLQVEEWLEAWREVLTPAEQRALVRMLEDEPTMGVADRKARSRATRKLRELLTESD